MQRTPSGCSASFPAVRTRSPRASALPALTLQATRASPCCKTSSKSQTLPSTLDKAGAYCIQGKEGRMLVENIDGDFYNVVGLPIARVARTIRDMQQD